MNNDNGHIVRAPLFPPYGRVRHLLRIWDGVPVVEVRDMINAIREQTGTPQDPVDWSKPDDWIGERLDGANAVLAWRIWQESGGAVNPRHVYGPYLLIRGTGLLSEERGVFRISEFGARFIAEEPEAVRRIDEREGIPKLLALVAEASPCRRGDLMDGWASYLRAVSKFNSPSTIRTTLWARLHNLAERGLITRDGNSYSISDAGLAWLEEVPPRDQTGRPQSSRAAVIAAQRAHNKAQREALRDRLMALDPYAFEHFVRDLLNAMDYENVEVTKQSGDKGVDVVADFQYGITEIKEVVQVKRTLNSINRTVVDSLRGALGYHNAIRGCIITLGSFARGAREGAVHPGVAPITLIDGESLLDLAQKHGVGLRRDPLDLYEVDESAFRTEEEPGAEETEKLE
ncbi:MAG: restriction endonuclease [Alphaproteobacteria bacterium]